MLSLNSKITKSILGFFFLHEHESLYINELVRLLKVDKRNLVKKLKELEGEGLFINKPTGNLKYYSLNKKYPLYNEYKKLVTKTIGFEYQLKNILIDIPHIKKAYIYGSYAKDRMDASSDIDIIVIGDHDIKTLQNRISSLQKTITRDINAINISEKEFKQKVKNKNLFIYNIMNNKKIKVF